MIGWGWLDRLQRMVVWIVALLCLLLALAWIATGAAEAQAANCAPRAVVLERLAERYGETRQGIGLGGSGTVVEMFANPQTGTWTLLATNTAGVTCLVASGHAFELTPAKPGPEGDPA